MDIKKELIFGIIGSVLVILLTIYYVGQYKNQRGLYKKSSQRKTASQSADPSQNVGTSLTVDEVSKHGSPSDCWLIISNSVYDVTQFLTLHPGGKNRIIPYCGQDATSAYSTKGGKGSHSVIADGDLVKLKIGQLNETINPTEANIRIQNDIKSIKSSEKKEREKEDDD